MLKDRIREIAVDACNSFPVVESAANEYDIVDAALKEPKS